MKFFKSFGKLALVGVVASAFFACSEDSSSGAADPVNAEEGMTPADTSSSTPVAKNRAWKIVENMGAGINLGNVFEAPDFSFDGFNPASYTSAWNETIVPENFVALGDSGFNHMRIPVSWEEHVTGAGAECVVDEGWMNQVFWAVDNAIANGMVVVLNAHHWDALYDDPDTESPCLLSVYRQMMQRVVNYSLDSLVVETLNEPRGKLTSAKWNVLVDSIISVVRAADPERVVMVGTYNYNSYSSISQLKLPAGVDNLIVTFHYYDPFAFTHQGATFVDPVYDTGTLWTASIAETRAVKKAFGVMKAWSDEHNIPIYLGEYGAYEMADDVSRETWTTFISTLASSLGFGRAYWEFCSGFGVYDDQTGEWKDYLMRALLHPTMTFEDAIYPNLDTLVFTQLDNFDGNEGESINVTTLSANIQKAKGEPVEEAPGRWYAYAINTTTITFENGDTLVTGDMVNDTNLSYTATNFERLVTENGHEGRGLYAHFNLNGENYPWVGIGTNFDGDKRINFANLKALTFWAKGQGTFKVSWKTDFADTCCVENWGTFSTEITLTSEWKQYVIWWDEWAPSPWSELESIGAEWKDHNDDVVNLQFSNGADYGETVLNEPMDIWLDDIRFYGMDGSEFGLTKAE
ncbi:MAG: glycoside hydrolase family 5 protein [Fibrobacter sp.]|nr:glycoside hydrolase family 5 protein [Fibrobacter sp.]